MNTVVLIPAYKPNQRMLDLLSELQTHGFTIIVVDDGSGEEYRALFDKAAACATILRHDRNKGKGEALKYGFSYIDEHIEKPYVCVTADADGQHRVEDIVKVSRTAAEHPDSLVVGKRTLTKSSPLLSRLGNGATRLFFHLATGRYIYETQTGLRGFGDQLAACYLRLPGKRYEYESDMMLISSDNDIIEVDIQTVYFDNNAATHFHPVFDTHRLHREYARYKLPSLIAACADYLLFVLFMLVSPLTAVTASICARIISFILKFVLHKAIFFSENLHRVRYLITCVVIVALEAAIIAGLFALSWNPYLAKLFSGFTMIFVSIGLRKLFVKISGK